MDNSLLNETIITYASSKNYEGAIMLTAEWGAGKSYYLQNELVPFLSGKGIRSIVVSLHGLKSDFEISRAIYVEYLLSKDKKGRIKNSLFKTKKRKNVINNSALAAKTIVKGVASFFSVDLNCSEKDLEKIYKSIDLSNTLVIFEDVERSKLPVDELLAYINNLVEYDQIKVILVTHEEKLKKDNIEKYKEIKEKTVGDTLLFSGNPVSAIDNMLKCFYGENTKSFFETQNENSSLTKLIVSEINSNTINLRSVMFGIEKFNSMIKKVDHNLDDEFMTNLLISCVSFVHKYRSDNTIKWSETNDASEKLSSYRFPLYRFVYDFIITNVLDVSALVLKEKEFKDYQIAMNAKNILNKRLSVLYNCYNEKENSVKEVVDYIRDSLKDKSIIPFELYFRIANYLVYLKYIIDYSKQIDDCLSSMLKNLKSLNKDDFDKISFHSGIVLENELAIKDFKAFKEEAEAIVKKNRMSPIDFSYKVSDVEPFCEMAIDSKDSYYIKHGFAVFLDINKLILLLRECTSLQISKIRGTFLTIYASSNIKDFFWNDKNNLDELLNQLEDDNNWASFDNIQKNQIRMFKGNLREILEKLERGY